MATVIGGHDTGLLDGSLYLLNRDDKTREGTAGHDEQLYVNVTNGNLVVRHTDAYLPSQGEDYAVVRTYNSRGNWNEGVGQGWTLTSAVELTQITKNNITLRNADGSYYEFEYDRATDIYTSTDGAGAYETITYDKTSRLYTLVRSDQTQLVFDGNGTLQQSTDTNGNTITYTYQSSKLVQVQDDTGHTITYEYGGSQGSELTRIVDSELGVLVEYSYSQGLLYSVTDRNGDVTIYQYYTDGTLAKITLPHDPDIEADIGKERAITFQYDPDTVDNSGTSRLLRYIWDAEGNPTAFEYQFYRDNQNNYNGGETVMINALGLYRSQSNDAEYVQWRLDNGYYAEWDPNSYNSGYFKDANGNYYFDQAKWDEYRAQTNEILTNHATWYYYDVDGNITLAGTFKTTGGNTVYEYADRYQYDADGNLTAVIDANGYALQWSDDPYWRDMRKELGYVDSLTGEGLLSSQLSSAQLAELAEFYTTHLEYDDRGNLIQKTDNEDNITTFTYTSFNKIASETSAMGHALTTSNELFYQEKRVELGYAADVAALSAADIDALLALHTTTYSYDANQNLVEIHTPGGDLTTFEYDMYGNVIRKIVYLDQNDLTDPAKQQITQYFYDAYGNNIKTLEANAWSITHSDDPYWVDMRKEFGIVDANGDGKLVADLSASDIDILTGNYTSYSNYDLFGNLLSYTDPNGGVTTYTYDNDNRLITVTDPESHTTVYAYDSVGNRIGVTDANGHTTIYVYDRNNMLIAVQDWKTALGNGPDDRTTTYKYDVVGNRTAVVDANGFETTYVYREDNRLLQVITPVVEDGSGNPVQYTTSYAYDALGNRIQMVDNNGNVINYVYNQNNLLKQTTDPIGNVSQYRYDANLNQVQITIGAQLAETQRRVLKYSYDEEDQLIAEVDAEGNVTRYSYDAVGNRVQVVDALGRVHEFEYDAQNRQIIETRPAVTDPYTGQPVQYTVVHYFDGNGNEIATTDENGHTTRVSYDKDDRAILIEDANGIKTVYTYDGNDNRTGVYIGVAAHLDNDGHVVFDNVDQAQITTYQYDEFNQVISRVDGLGNALVESDDPQYIQMRAELGYVDGNGNGKLAADLTALEQAELKALYTERYSYDKVGNLTQTIDNEERLTSYAYDGLNRRTSMTDALSNTRTTHYDGNGNQVNVTDALGRTTTFTYDANDRLIDTTDANGVVTHREYDDFGNLRFETRAYGSLEARTAEYRYDLNNRLIDTLDPEGHQTHYRYDAVGNRLEVVTAYGTAEAQSTQYVYDALNRNIKIIDPLSFETRYEYDGVGNRIAITDANGGITRFDYDPGNRRIQTTDAEGRVTSYSYDVRGNRITTTDGNGNVTTFEYDAENNLRKVIDAEGNVTEHDFDRVYNRIATTDGNGHTTSYAFDALNRQIAMTDALGNTTSYSYDAVGNRTTITDALGRVRTFEYDNVNRLITETAADGVQTTYSYDEVDNRTSITYAANTAQAATTTFVYNKDDQLISETDALGNVTSYTYDANHNRTVVTDANGNATTYSYDANNRVTHITDALGHVTQYVYDGNGNRVQVIDANGNTTTTYYNADNEVTMTVDAEGYAVINTYDNNGNVVSQTLHMTALTGPLDPYSEPTPTADPAQDQTTTYEYDGLNRQVAMVDGEGYRTTTAYDAVGNIVERVDGNGNSTVYTYDDVNRLVTMVDAEGGITAYTYDAVGNRTSLTDANEHTTTYAYDLLNRLIETTDALGGITQSAYDAVGNRISFTDANGHTIQYEFDLVNRLTKEIDALGIETVHTYDSVGNRLSTTVAANTTQAATLRLSYDKVYNLVSTTDPLGSVTSYTYDANRNRLSLNDGNGNVTTYAYDGNNRLISETDPLNNTITYVYDGAGNQVQYIDARGYVSTSYYDAKNQLIAQIDAEGYLNKNQYDANGNLVSQTAYANAVFLPADPLVEPIPVADPSRDQTVAFVYDGLNREVSRTDGEGYVNATTYDAIGNVLTTTNGNGGITRFIYDELNRMVQSIDAEGAITQYSYDAVGNRVSVVDALNHMTAYRYDENNQLISQTDALGVETTYAYDAVGNRIAMTEAANTAQAVITIYNYDLANNLISETDALGNITSYTYDANYNRLSNTDANGYITYFSYDTNNRLINVIDPLGHQVQYVYDESGNQVQIIDAKGNAITSYYDGNGNTVLKIDAEGYAVTSSFDANGNLVEQTRHMTAISGVIDPASQPVIASNPETDQTIRYEYNLVNHKIAIVDAEGYRTSYIYDAVGNVLSSTDALGNVTNFTYDAVNRLTRTDSADGASNVYTYDAVGNQLTSTDGNGHTTTYVYDDLNRVVTEIDANGASVHSLYDAIGNKVAVVDENGNQTQYQYDAINQLVKEVDALGVETVHAYDTDGNRISTTTAANTAEFATTTYTYDADNNIVSQTDPLGNVTTYTYDANHNRISMTDPNGNTTIYLYDNNNRVISEIDALDQTVSYTYDGAGNRIQVTDAKGNVTSNYYNEKNELVLTINPEGYATTYIYDGNGNVVSQTLYMTQVSGPVTPDSKPVIPTSASDQTIQFEYDSVNRVSARIDAEDYRTEFGYDLAGNRIEIRQQITADSTIYSVNRTYYDEVDRVTHQLTAEGYLTSYTYDAAGNRISSTTYNNKVAVPVSGVPIPDAGDTGRTTTYTYDANNRLVSETSAMGITTAYTYDDRGNRASVINAQGTADEAITTFVYDNADRTVDIIDANGIVTHHVYDANGNIVERYDAYGLPEQRVTSYVYDGINQVISETNALGVTTTYTYDANGNRLTTTLASGVAGVERTITSEYDANNRIIAETNGEGERTEYVYDGAGNRIETIQAPGLAEERHNTFEYDHDNRLTASVDAFGTRTEYVYDGAGNKLQTTQALGQPEARNSYYVYDLDNNLIQVTDPEGGVTQYTYDALGNQIQIIDANGGVQISTFDAVGQLIQTVSAGGVMTVNTYDARGNITSMTQSWADGTDARTTTYTFDKLDQQISTTDAEGFTSTVSYDVFGNQVQVTNGQYLVDSTDPSYDPDKAARAHVVTSSFTFDAADRMTSMTDGVGTVTEYYYNAVGNRTQVIETANEQPRITTYSYDLANRQTSSVNPEGGQVETLYDAVGNKIEERKLQRVDGAGNETWVTATYEYDANDHLIAEVDSYGVRTEHDYDAMGNMTAHRYAAGTADERVVRMEYDFNNRLVADIDAEGNRTSYTYDSLGNRTSVTDALGRVASYQYDGSNNLIAVTDPEGYTTHYQYNSAGNQIRIELGGRVTQFVYNGANNISLRVDADGSETRYTYDGAGNLLTETQYANTSAPREMSYAYDNNNRLIEFTDVDGTITTFTYDAANNKTSETIYNANDPNTTRTTVYEYDLNNRKVTQIFDPNGLNYVQTIAYDALGNVVNKTDANGVAIAYQYDLNNRVTSEVRDPGGLNLTTSYVYDAVGNLISETDPRGNTTDYVYNNNNQQTQVIAPEVSVYTIDGGERLERPTITRVYDAAGNVIQEIDPNGFKTTRYYDGNDRIVAEIDAHNALREYRYNATGEQVEVKLYMTRLSDADHDPYTRPAAPAGEVRVTSNIFDAAGRIIETQHPETEITTLVGADTDSPSVTTQVVRASETWSYDQFGNQVEYIDKNGNRNLYYYDVAGNMIASVNGAGYLTEWDYDAQGNQLEQRTYATPVDVNSLDPSIYPTAPAGEVAIITNVYDAASHLIEERTPAFDVYNPLDPANPASQQQITRYTYDGNGNQLTKTLAAGSGSEITEYSYYDNNDRLIAVINGERVLHRYTYDANGNVTKQERLYNTVPTSVDLTTLNGDSDFRALVVADAANDQTTEFEFDVMNRRIRETDLMGPGATDDLTQIYKYNATQQQTWVQDEDGYVTRMAFNGLGLAELTISPDGSGMIAEYDAAGNQISGFMGLVENQTTPATNITATVSDTLNLSWDLGGSVSMGSRVVYGTSSQATPDGYAQQTGFIGSWGQSSASAAIDLSNLSAGDTLYFRVLTQDQAGNVTWSEEKSVTIPPRVTDVAVSQPASDSVTITANFEGGAQNPVLLYGAIQNTVNPVNFVQQPDGSWEATITGVSNLQDLAYQIQWSDAAGQTYTSAEQTFEASGGHTAVISTLGEGTVTTATGTGYVMNLHTEVPTALAETFSVVTADWRLTGAGTGYASTANEGVLDAGGAFYNFDLTLGSSSAPLDAGEYEVVIRGVDADGNAVILDTLTYTVGQATPETLTSQSVSLAAPAIGDSQLVIVDGVRVDSVRQDGYATFDINASGTQAYQIYYTEQLAETHTSNFVSDAISHTVDITSTEVIITNPDLTTTTTYDLGINATFSDWEVAQMASGVTLSWRPAGSAGAYTNVLLSQNGNSFATTLSGLSGGQYELQLSYTDINGQTVVASTTTADTAVASDSATYVTGYNLAVSSALSAAEVANISGDITLYWRDAANVDPSGLDFTNSQVLSLDGATNTLSGLIENVAAGQYDIKIAYTDVNGNEVVMDWYRADTAVASDSNTDYSQTLLGAEERDGSVTLNANGTISVDPGLYIGDLDSAGLASELSLSVTATGQAGGSRDANGQSTGYFTEITYNALDQVIAEIGNDGLYKEYGVDANGNKVVTYNDGEQGNPDVLMSYAAYDARDRMIAQFDTAFVPEGGSSAQHPVTRFAYNYMDNVVSQTDARGYTTSTTYNALGQKTSMTDASGATTTWYYDIRGNEVAVTDGLGNTARKEYDDFGRITAEINGEGNQIDYTYDVFGRKLTMARAGNVTSYAYDQRDRTTSMTDPLGGVTRYEYDGRDNQIWVYDPRWSETDSTYKYGQKYDEMGRVVETYSYQDGQLATEQQVYDYYGNLIAEIDAMGRTKTTSYEGFGRVTETVDEGGQRIIKEYDAYGRMIREYDPNSQKDIRYSYDDNGNRTAIDDLATGVSTVYTYDLAGNRITETITTGVDAQGESTHNRDYNYIYDSRGNLVRWADSVTGMHLNYWYDAAGNLQRAYTDLGYDPDNQNTANDPTFRHVDHWYQYDSANRLRLMTEGQNGEIISEYGYDSAGNRVYWNNKGNAVNYTFDANGQVKTGTWYTGSGADQVTHEQKWTYDKVGNVLTYRVYENGTQKEYSVYKYYENNTQYYSNSKPVDSDDASTTTSSFDLSGRLTGKVMRGNDYAITYHYEYYADGREKKITASGDSKGSSSFAYDANDNQIKVNLGKGNDQSRAEISTFLYDNEGHIIYKWHDDGESDTREKVEYAYANSNPVGETGVDNDAKQATKLDVGDYNLVDNFGDTFPDTSVTLYKVNRGDTLQSIAAALYGKPSLWFVIAEANGLNGTEQLEAGRQLEVPNSVASGRLTNESHALYNESDIIGSTLPNLQAEGGGGGGCLQLLAIVIVVAIAIIAPYAVAALAGVMTAALGTIAAYAIAGAVVYAAANIIQQGLLMAIGVQEEFDWGQVGTAAVSGLFSGLAQGIQVDALKTAAETGKTLSYAKTASAALKVVSVASKQLLTDGKITNWTGLITAGVGQYLETAQSINAGLLASGQKTLSEAARTFNDLQDIQTVVDYASPWVQLAETYIRNDGELSPMDWAGAVSSTLSQVVTDDGASQIQNVVNRLGVNLLVAGVVGSRSDVSREEAQSFFFDSVGNEIGQLIGQGVVGHLSSDRPTIKNEKDLEKIEDPMERLLATEQFYKGKIKQAGEALRAYEDDVFAQVEGGVGHFDGGGDPRQKMINNALGELDAVREQGYISEDTYEALKAKLESNPELQSLYAELHFMTKAGMVQPDEYKEIMSSIDFTGDASAISDALQSEISLSKEFHNAIRNFDLMERYAAQGKGIILVSDPAKRAELANMSESERENFVNNDLIIPITVPEGKTVEDVYNERLQAFEQVQRAFNTSPGQVAPTGDGLEALRRFALDDVGSQTIAAINADIDFDIANGLRDKSGQITDKGILAQAGLLDAGQPYKTIFEIRGHKGLGAHAGEGFIDIGTEFLSATHTGGDEVFAPAVIAHEFGHTRFNPSLGYDPARTVEAGYSDSIINNFAGRGIGSAKREFTQIVNPIENAYRERYGVDLRDSYTYEDGTTYYAPGASSNDEWPFNPDIRIETARQGLKPVNFNDIGTLDMLTGSSDAINAILDTRTEYIAALANKYNVNPEAIRGVIEWEFTQNWKGRVSDIWQLDNSPQSISDEDVGIGFGSMHQNYVDMVRPGISAQQSYDMRVNLDDSLGLIAAGMDMFATQYAKGLNVDIRDDATMLSWAYNEGLVGVNRSIGFQQDRVNNNLGIEFNITSNEMAVWTSQNSVNTNRFEVRGYQQNPNPSPYQIKIDPTPTPAQSILNQDDFLLGGP